jgi:hypothetical protein
MYNTDEARAVARAISDFVNRYGNTGNDELVAEMLLDHPTLQQGTMRLFLTYARAVAAQPYVDGRNTASRTVARQIVALWPDGKPSLPMI